MKYITDEKEIEKIKRYMNFAAKEAKKSTCKKSQRGVIIVKDNQIIGRGYNKVMLKDLCDPCIRKNIKDNSKVELCSAIHAEQMAIIDAVTHGKSLNGSKMYHIKVKNEEIRPSGKPSCTICSRMLYEAGIKFILWHEDGYIIYSPEELNELSFKYFLEK